MKNAFSNLPGIRGPHYDRYSLPPPPEIKGCKLYSVMLSFQTSFKLFQAKKLDPPLRISWPQYTDLRTEHDSQTLQVKFPRQFWILFSLSFSFCKLNEFLSVKPGGCWNNSDCFSYHVIFRINHRKEKRKYFQQYLILLIRINSKLHNIWDSAAKLPIHRLNSEDFRSFFLRLDTIP